MIDAKMNNKPPSLLTSISNTNKYEIIAPIIVSNANSAPKNVVLGNKIKIDAINSTIPELIFRKALFLMFEKCKYFLLLSRIYKKVFAKV